MDEDYLVKHKVAQYLLLGQDIKDLQEQQKRLKQELEPHLQAADTNARGSRVIVFSDALDVSGTKYSGLQKVRKESKVLNEERALAFIQDHIDLSPYDITPWLSAIVTERHVDQDALWELYVQDMITQGELDSFFDVTESYAFMPTKE